MKDGGGGSMKKKEIYIIHDLILVSKCYSRVFVFSITWVYKKSMMVELKVNGVH